MAVERGIPALPAFAEKPRSGRASLTAGERLGVAMSVQLDELMSLRRQEEASRLLRVRSLARDLEDVLEVRVVEELPPPLLEPPEALHVQ